jgi:hypothetical protein
MGFWSKAARAVGCVVTLGGTERVRVAGEKWRNDKADYDRILQEAASLSNRLTEMLRFLGSQTEFAFKRLQVAHRILAPLEQHNDAQITISVRRPDPGLRTISNCTVAIRDFTAIKAAAQGSAAGTALGIGSWTAVSLLGSASTGVGISALHGVAATNATLAWFGGGSLATGGLGMAGGGAILGGIVLLPLIALSTWKTHSKAREIERALEEIQRANEQNRAAISLLEDRTSKVALLIPTFRSNVEQLSADIRRTERALFRFGWLSRLWRRVRSYFVGYYYGDADIAIADELARSVERFLAQFSEQKKLLAANTAE